MMCRNHPEWNAPIESDDYSALHAEAIERGDDEQARLCVLAIAGNRTARRKCDRVILAARAQCDCDGEGGRK